MSDNLLVAVIIGAAMVWVGLTLQKALDGIAARLDAIEERLGITERDVDGDDYNG